MARDTDLSHIAIVEAYLERHPRTVRGLGEWRRYDAGIWPVIHEQIIKREIQAIAEAEANAGLAVRLDYPLINSVHRLLQDRTFVPAERFDANPEILTLDDCCLHLPTREPLAHNPRNYCTSKLPFAYDPEVRSDVWTKFLADTVPDATAFLQEFAGYCLTTSTEYEMALWLYGPPGGGKSTFIGGLQAMLGARSFVLGLSDIAGSHFGLTNLPGKTLAISTEQPASFISVAHIINTLISGEPIPVNRKYKDPIEVRCRAKFVWAMNELPRATGLGLFRRVKVVHFPGVLAELRDPRVRETIEASGMAITNWALDGGRRLQERGRFVVPASVETESNEYRISNDVPQLFLDECCELESDVRTPATDLYATYSRWCETNGHYRESSTKFGIDMTRLGLERFKSNIVFRLGVKVKEEWEDQSTNLTGWEN